MKKKSTKSSKKSANKQIQGFEPTKVTIVVSMLAAVSLVLFAVIGVLG